MQLRKMLLTLSLNDLYKYYLANLNKEAATKYGKSFRDIL